MVKTPIQCTNCLAWRAEEEHKCPGPLKLPKRVSMGRLCPTCGYYFDDRADTQEHVRRGCPALDKSSVMIESTKAFKYACMFKCGFSVPRRHKLSSHELQCSHNPSVDAIKCQLGCGYVSIDQASVSFHENGCSRNLAARLPHCRFGCGHTPKHKDEMIDHEEACQGPPRKTNYNCQFGCGHEAPLKHVIGLHEVS